MESPEDPLLPLPTGLHDAVAELNNLILAEPDIAQFLHDLAAIMASLVPHSHCGITLRHEGEFAGVAGVTSADVGMDEIRYLQRHGPCVEAIQTATAVLVPDLSVETRWAPYVHRALGVGVRSSASLPLIVENRCAGAVNLFSPTPHAFGHADLTRASAFTNQAAGAITILLRQNQRLTLDEQLREALSTRAVIDQALGIMMHARRISSREAFEALRQASQTTNRKVSDIAADLITRTTGRPPDPPRPLSDRDRFDR